MKPKFTFLLAFFFSNICFGNQSEIAPDSIPGKVTAAVLKINPIQFLFNEIPVSFELFSGEESSVQLQVGYIFPASGSGGLFESNGTNGDASSEGILSYRNSPFNNHGISVKFEFRKYGKYFYHGGQVMFKHTHYENAVFDVYGAGITFNQTENKSSVIFGFGYVIGRQSDDRNLIFDWYAAIGFRMRAMEVKILEIENPAYPKGTTYPNTTDTFTKVYPFVNLGVRIGFRLQKTVWV